MTKAATLAFAGLSMLAAPLHAQDMRMDIGPVAYQGSAAAVNVRVSNLTNAPYRDLRFECEFRSAGGVLATATFTLAALDPNASETLTVQAETGTAPVEQVACRGLF